MRKLIALLVFVLLPAVAVAQQSVVEKYRAGYPTPMSNDQLVSLLKQVAAEVGGGILVKTAGDNCNGYACDVICFADGRLFDVLVNKHGTAQPAWQGPDQLAGRRCELVTAAPPGPSPTPTPTPVPSDLEARLATLEARVAALEHAPGPIPTPTPGPTGDVAADVKRIRQILEAAASKFGIR